MELGLGFTLGLTLGVTLGVTLGTILGVSGLQNLGIRKIQNQKFKKKTGGLSTVSKYCPTVRIRPP